jgi:hypothetical protein
MDELCEDDNDDDDDDPTLQLLKSSDQSQHAIK